MKRSLLLSPSDSELDVEEHKNMKEPVLPSTLSQSQARKKRRGIVEKRRRDRINNSLSELRRLVPSAWEKQGSTKLEKAEILQMTVDHLKVLHTSGGKGHFETPILTTDYGILGFRECLSEVARYLSVIEGLDHSDPLKARLVSHLNTCVSQREVVTAEKGHQLLCTGYPHQFVLTSLSHFSPDAFARSFPPSEHNHRKESMLSGVHLEHLNKLSSPGFVVPILTNAANVTSSIFPITSLSATQFPFSIDPLLPAALVQSPVQTVKSGKHFWTTEVGTF
ncbi:hairy/enhancer-of-split related with YRPW motif protein 1-like [Hemiscyllium ocellatum]|uniref:hairy/enhancer-of-split related with YRPW motif protein 1-like n=1 Tax=Hemiscyllium ocellatum TaxID=170820 RepID=UPI002966729E|nr:hairy/enhancer-of-split related with YRPW motif protein 1-like [Hemiscyllium ocellatum]